MDEKTLAAYLDRIAVARPPELDEAALGLLHRAHQMAVPFENLSIHLAEPISLDEDDLLDKIVTRRRGGFCYELNGAFALLLLALGAQVARVAARVYGDGGSARPSTTSPWSCAWPTAAVPGWPTSASAATAPTRSAMTAGRSRTTRPAGSRSPMPGTRTWTCSRTASRSTGSSRGRACWPTSSPPAGGSRPRPILISPRAPSARGSPTTAGSPSAAAR